MSQPVDLSNAAMRNGNGIFLRLAFAAAHGKDAPVGRASRDDSFGELGSATPPGGSGQLAAAAAAGWAESAFTRAASRDTLRDAVLAWMTPFWAERITADSVAIKTSRAAAASPLAIASSALRICVRIALRRMRFTAVRRASFRTAVLAEEVFAIDGVPELRPLGTDGHGRRRRRSAVNARL